jgi:hypothetical protein
LIRVWECASIDVIWLDVKITLIADRIVGQVGGSVHGVPEIDMPPIAEVMDELAQPIGEPKPGG